MHRVVLKSVAVTLAIVAIGQILSFGSRMAAGKEFTLFVAIMNTALPLVTALPASLLIFCQSHRLQLANAALELARAKLEIKASYDGLTGLLNRETFFSRAEEAASKSASGSLLILDADNFKQINDKFGHGEGDVALRLIAHALREAAGNSSIIGRVGGEEFAIFLAKIPVSAGLVAAEAIRRAVSNSAFYPAFGKRQALTVSIGVAATAAGVELQQSYRAADAALYKAKHRGRNTVVFADDQPTSHLSLVPNQLVSHGNDEPRAERAARP